MRCEPSQWVFGASCLRFNRVLWFKHVWFLAFFLFSFFFNCSNRAFPKLGGLFCGAFASFLHCAGSKVYAEVMMLRNAGS